MTTTLRNPTEVNLHDSAGDLISLSNNVVTEPAIFLGYYKNFEGNDERNHEMDTVDAKSNVVDPNSTAGSIRFVSTTDPGGPSTLTSKRKITVYGTTRVEFSFLMSGFTAVNNYVIGFTDRSSAGTDTLFVNLKGDGTHEVEYSHGSNTLTELLDEPIQSNLSQQTIIGIEYDLCSFKVYEKVDGEIIYLKTIHQTDIPNSYPTLGQFYVFSEMDGDNCTVDLYGWRVFHLYAPLSNRYLTKLSHAMVAPLTFADGEYKNLITIQYKGGAVPLRPVCLKSVSVYMSPGAANAFGTLYIARGTSPAPTMTGNLGNITVMNHSESNPDVTGDGSIVYSAAIHGGQPTLIELDPPIQVYPSERLSVTYRASLAQDVIATMNWLED